MEIGKWEDWVFSYRNLVFAILALLLAMQISTNWKPDPDGVNYLSIARNVALHGKLERQGSRHLYYAPGYSILISPAFFFGDRPFAEIGMIHLVLAILLMVATYRWFARYDSRAAIFIVAFVMVNAGFWDLFRQTRAEVAFMAALMGAAVVLAGVFQSKSRSRFILTTVTGAFLLAAACSIRQVGFLLAAGFGVSMLMTAMRREIGWSRAIMATLIVVGCSAMTAAAVLAYDVRTAKQAGPDEITYFENRRDRHDSFAGQVIEGVRRQTAEVGRLMLPGMWKSYSKPHTWFSFNTHFYLLFFGIIAVGWWKLMRVTADPLVATFPFYFFFFVVWPFDQGTRFTVPMLPVLAGSVWCLLKPLGDRRASVFLGVIVLHLLISVGIWLRDAYVVRKANLQWSTMQHVANAMPNGPGIWIAREVNQDQWLLLAYASDRRFSWQMHSDAVPARTFGIISPAGVSDVPGFETIRVVEGFKIEQRVGATTDLAG